MGNRGLKIIKLGVLMEGDGKWIDMWGIDRGISKVRVEL